MAGTANIVSPRIYPVQSGYIYQRQNMGKNGYRQPFLKPIFKIRFQHLRYCHRAVFLLVVFQDGEQGSAYGQA